MNFFQKTLNNKTFFIAEIGINHNGNIKTALELIDAAKLAGCNAVKFQKRDPEICVPLEEWDIKRDTPWGVMRYIDYKKKIEFGKKEYNIIDKHCKKLSILWTASCWDTKSVDFIESYKVKFHKVASACITDINLLKKLKKTKKPVTISTGMSTEKEIRNAVNILTQKTNQETTKKLNLSLSKSFFNDYSKYYIEILSEKHKLKRNYQQLENDLGKIETN